MFFQTLINQILVLYLIILAGYVAAKKGIITEELTRVLSNLLIKVTHPALIVSAMAITYDPAMIAKIKGILLLSFISYLLLIVFSNLTSKKLSLDLPRKNVLKFSLIFGNVGYMGYPILNIIYPETGVFYANLANKAFGILIYSYGIHIFSKTKDNGMATKKNKGIKLNNIINNGFMASIIGLTLFFSRIQLPGPVLLTLKSVGNMTFPLSMLIIGSSITKIKNIRQLTNKYVLLISLLKLLIIPIIIFLVLGIFFPINDIFYINAILMAMPVATTVVIFSKKYNSDDVFATESVSVTALLTLFSIPLFLWVMDFFSKILLK